MKFIRAVVAAFIRGAKEQIEKDAELWAYVRSEYRGMGMGFPGCVQCHRHGFIAVSYPRYTMDRFSRERITLIVQCENCGLQHTARKMPGGKWSFRMQS